ncbi:MAG: hypothetical protein M3Y41_10585 [Pseudomonadota bacterium]|nr:hypothetical protein [Pseudomonadota bacterium]
MSLSDHVPGTAKALPSSQRLNQDCFCITLDRETLCRAFEKEAGDPAFCASLIEARPNLFSNVAVFASAEAFARMQAVVRAIETAAQLPAYRDAVLSWAPGIARFDPGPLGAFMGYDFHLDAGSPKLIEVNTNAGGAFLNALLARAQDACCAETIPPTRRSEAGRFEPAVLHMFQAEWERQRGSRALHRVAIVDDAPEGQYLYPEFVLARQFFRKQGMEAVIADGRRLVYADGILRFEGQPIDLVYNRLVDFALDRPEHAPLQAAYRDGAVVVTPNPHVHALFADKRNLTLLSDPERLETWGVGTADLEVLAASILKAVLVTADNAGELWSDRKRYFFKPAGGHGGKAAYRGDKLTRTVWSQIMKGGYVAQAFAPPGGRTLRVEGASEPFKADIRLYTYAGTTLLSAARLYQGQTTNFRTPGGGFAPVFQVG